MEFDELRSRFYFVRKRFHEAERWQKNFDSWPFLKPSSGKRKTK
jgi:hypothetical protein